MSKTKQIDAPKEKRSTKMQAVIAMLKQDGGADVLAIAAVTGWQAHSVRGAIAGHIKKKLGLAVTTVKVEGRTVYRIEA